MAGTNLGITNIDEAEAVVKKLQDSINSFGNIAQQCATCGSVCAEHKQTLGLGDTLAEFMAGVASDLNVMVQSMNDGYNVLNGLVKGASAGQEALLGDVTRALSGM